MHIVLVEDNKILAKSTIRVLKQEGYSTTHFADGSEAERWLVTNKGVYDMIILDILLPSTDGFMLCKNVRAEEVLEPILMLTSKDTLEDTIKGLDYGADDYLKKPFAVDELLVRIRTLLRRPPLTMAMAEIEKSIPGVHIDMKSHAITTSTGNTISLTAKEFAIVLYFIRNPNEIITQQRLYDHIFDFAEVQMSNAIEVHIKNIRKKFKAQHHEIPLTTIRGAGYQLVISSL